MQISSSKSCSLREINNKRFGWKQDIQELSFSYLSLLLLLFFIYWMRQFPWDIDIAQKGFERRHTRQAVFTATFDGIDQTLQRSPRPADQVLHEIFFHQARTETCMEVYASQYFGRMKIDVERLTDKGFVAINKTLSNVSLLIFKSLFFSFDKTLYYIYKRKIDWPATTPAHA